MANFICSQDRVCDSEIDENVLESLVSATAFGGPGGGCGTAGDIHNGLQTGPTPGQGNGSSAGGAQGA
ncbi:hypothetical protein [Vibrio vulnificus]|uniref:Uncharacterized protein n=1 Tax=Vibrio vulnificus TaxID=672 RepID=A0AAN1PM18_VIBVL|nr:hypothetical protein [Vibrio vulnificus]AXX58822.1 hypothetical protein FORC53_0483 [Vibrio vulnificus]MCG8704034.1 hypothetical protein [Vibrio vulnificus]MCG8704043.1 hypothetical protein [Vibrio vulnificus]